MENKHPQNPQTTGTTAAVPDEYKLISKELSTENLSEEVAGKSWAIINMSVQPQEQSNWCWLACSVSVHNFYWPNNPVTQCHAANQMLGLPCCNNPLPSGCNAPGFPSDCLRAMNNLNKTVSINNLSFPEIKTEINRSQPMVIGYTNAGSQTGHAVVLVGYDTAGYVRVIDPSVGIVDRKYADLIFYYSQFFSEVCFTRR